MVYRQQKTNLNYLIKQKQASEMFKFSIIKSALQRKNMKQTETWDNLKVPPGQSTCDQLSLSILQGRLFM